jgi:hypothetical protein
MFRSAFVRLTLLSVVLIVSGVQSSLAFFDGQTGVIERQLKAACPAFASGGIKLVDSTSPPGNMPIVDVFEHDSGARCSCTLSRIDRNLRCGPSAPGVVRNPRLG